MSLIEINKERCGRDGLCTVVCPANLIKKEEDGSIKTVENAKAQCFACGHCIAICPKGALTLSGVAPEELPEVKEDLKISRDQIAQLMKSRRSVRLYKETPVTREIIEELLNIARFAPSARNVQPLQWLILDSPGEVRTLAGIVVDGFRDNASMTSFIEAYDRGRDIVFRGAPHLVIAYAREDGFIPSVDCTIALTYLELAAAVYGLGTCWAGFLMRAAALNPLIEKHLNIPGEHRLYGALMLGYPRHRYARIPPRKPLIATWR